MGAGRPTKYTQELGDDICERIATTSHGLRYICDSVGIGVTTVLMWLRSIPEFQIQYARAKEEQADMLADEIIQIADDSAHDTEYTEFGPKENKEWVNRSRLRVDARKWVASKLKPKKYGDKLELDGGLHNTNEISGELLQQIAEKINSNRK